MTRDEALAILTEGQQELARRSLLGFTSYTFAGFQANWHHQRMCTALDGVLDGTIRRLMVFMPPQNGKSEIISRRFPAYALGRRPDLQLLATAYNADKATEESHEVQQIVESRDYRTLFPHVRLATARDVGDVRMAARFDIPGYRGAYRSAGVGQGIAGKPMNIGIIDDPVKNRAEAESETFRKTVWNWYVADFSARQTTDQAAIILVQTRWHEDDLAGRLLALARKNPLADQWHVVSFPAVCDELRPDDPRALGEALWPTRFSREWLEAKRISSGVYDWSALYQQRPIPAGGAMAQRAWFRIGPKPAAGSVVRMCRAWDVAGTKKTPGREPDWTVGTLLAQVAGGQWAVMHVIRVRDSPAGVDRLIKQTAQADGRGVMVREERVGLAGKVLEAAHLRLLDGWDYRCTPIAGQGDKANRLRPFLIQAEGGNVQLVDGEWNREWLDELQSFPYGVHDDQADSVGCAYNELAGAKVLGPGVGSILPQNATVSGPSTGAWRQRYFQRAIAVVAEAYGTTTARQVERAMAFGSLPCA